MKLSTERVRQYRLRLKNKLGVEGFKKRRNQAERIYRLKKKFKQEHSKKKNEDDNGDNVAPTVEPLQEGGGTVDDPVEVETSDEEGCIPVVAETTEHLVFKHPCTCIISGPSRSGKTHLMGRVLKFRREMFNPPVAKVIWFYGAEGSTKELREKLKESEGDGDCPVEFVQGMPGQNWLNKQDPSVNKLIVLDDLQDHANTGFVSQMFTKNSHHSNISCFFLVQNMFGKEKDMRTSSMNTNYRIVFNNPADQVQTGVLSKNILGVGNSNQIREIMNELRTEGPYAYLALDLHPRTEENLRIRTNIFPDDTSHLVYIWDSDLND